jgi:FOG: EAL domain
MASNNKMLILVVDDKEINRLLLKAMLSDSYNVCEASNGKEALEQLEKYGTSIKAILLDLIMPVMDGHTFLEEVKKTPHADVPVIVLTGANDPEVEESALKDGASDFITKPYQPTVLKRRLQNAIDHSSLATLHLIKHMAEHDALTDLYNRSFFFEETHKMLATNPDMKFTFIRFDIEHFRNLNSYWGDEGGNQFLKYLAAGFRQIEEQYSHITYGRITADVFCLCIPSAEYNEDKILNNILIEINNYDSKTFIKPVLGVYEIQDNLAPVEKIYTRASAAAQRCKQIHTQYVCYFDEKMSVDEADEEEIISEMKEALETGQFIAYYQPKYSLKTDRMYGAEALVRWNHPEKGLIPPGKFIPIFEKNGFIKDLDQYMWNTVAHQIRIWIDLGYEPTPISVNISRVSINNPDIVEIMADIVKKNNIPASLLNLEITESAYMDNPEIMTDIVNNFKKNGFTVMMDDFGSGYSSLNTLKNIPVDVLKIDMKFIEGEDREGKGRIILSSVIRMAGWLGMPVIVEGVEEEYQSNFLRSMGCGYIQGYYYAKPMPVSEYEKIIRNQVKGIPEPFEEVKVKEDAAVLWTQDAKIQAIFDQVHFPSGVCTEDHGKIYPLLVNNAYIDKYGYGTSIIDPEEKNSLIKEEKQMQLLYRLLEKSFEEKTEAIESREEKDEKGNLIRTSGLVDYMFSINNQRVYFFAVIEQKQ